MDKNIYQTSGYHPELVLVGRAQDASKLTHLKKDKVPKFRLTYPQRRLTSVS
jgi:hypothetical protein